jgi:hypothetical protein
MEKPFPVLLSFYLNLYCKNLHIHSVKTFSIITVVIPIVALVTYPISVCLKAPWLLDKFNQILSLKGIWMFSVSSVGFEKLWIIYAWITTRYAHSIEQGFALLVLLVVKMLVLQQLYFSFLNLFPDTNGWIKSSRFIEKEIECENSIIAFDSNEIIFYKCNLNVTKVQSKSIAFFACYF